MNRILFTKGNGYFEETTYQYPTIDKDIIIVKNVMTGICRSDIDMMVGEFGPLPLNMQGHEGLGQVIEIGTEIKENVKVGDFVATRGEPAYADFYPVKNGEFVVVPEAHPKYIIEPVACGINLVVSHFDQILKRYNENTKVLILGSGFLSYVAFNTLKLYNNEIKNLKVDVIGNSNKDIWQQIDVDLKNSFDDNYDIVIDLKGQENLFLNENIIKNNGLFIEAVSRSISKKESEFLLWKSITTVRPSPRNDTFLECMQLGVKWIEDNKINVDNFWSKSYNRTTDWKQAFSDGVDRPKNYSRGYIVWG